MQIQPIPHPLTGLFEGIQRGISLGLTMNKLKQEQKEREELLNIQKQKAQAEQEYRQKENDMKMFESGFKMLSDKNISKDTKLNIYNSIVAPTGKRLGLPMAVINDWPDGMDDYVKRASAIYNNKDYSWQEKKGLILSIMVEAGKDPRFEAMMEDIKERLKKEEKLAEQKVYKLYYRLLSGETTPDETKALTDELENILDKYPDAYENAYKMATENRRNELLMRKTQKEIETPKTEYKLYYNPKTGQTMYVDILNEDEKKNARRQGYLPWAGDVFKSKADEGKYTLPQKLDDLRAEYNRMIDTIDRKYGLKGGGVISKTIFDLDENQRARYLKDIDDINAAYNKRYKELTGKDAPFLVSPKEVSEGKPSPIGIKPSLDEIFGGK